MSEADFDLSNNGGRPANSAGVRFCPHFAARNVTLRTASLSLAHTSSLLDSARRILGKDNISPWIANEVKYNPEPIILILYWRYFLQTVFSQGVFSYTPRNWVYDQIALKGAKRELAFFEAVTFFDIKYEGKYSHYIGISILLCNYY